MSKQLKLILKEVPTGLPPTPKQSAQRAKFAKATKEAAMELKGTNLKGAARVRKLNRLVSDKLTQGPELP